MNADWAANKFILEFHDECEGEDDTTYSVFYTYPFEFDGSVEEAAAIFKANYALANHGSFNFMGLNYRKRSFMDGNEYIWPNILTLEEWFENNKTNRERV